MNWIIFGLVLFLVVIDWMIGRNTIKKCEAEMVRALKHAERMKNYALDTLNEAWVFKMAQVDEKVQLYKEEILMKVHEKLKVQNEEVIQELRKETAGMKDWVEKRLEGTVDLVKAILDQADAKIKIADANIEIANKIHSKPAELKLTVNFKGQK